MKKLGVIIALCTNFYGYTAPFVTTLINNSNLAVKLEIHFSDKSIESEHLDMSHSYQLVNFPNKFLDFIELSSDEKDINGNFYKRLHKNFSQPKNNETYSIDLQSIPAHTIPAGVGTEAFEMPITQGFTCTLQSKH